MDYRRHPRRCRRHDVHQPLIAHRANAGSVEPQVFCDRTVVAINHQCKEQSHAYVASHWRRRRVRRHAVQQQALTATG